MTKSDDDIIDILKEIRDSCTHHCDNCPISSECKDYESQLSGMLD